MTTLLAIVGSKCATYADVAPIVRRVCAGVDLIAASVAKLEYELPVIECQPAKSEWHHYRARNVLIASLCTRLVRIASARSTTFGSGFTRDYAANLGKPTEEYEVG
jgi:hypothetical protein